ncbi:hypothetical protein Xcel_0139 [Xylanimonas cellulosilytica DSM 15894]|uniref:DUF4190 domain-containing protein n=1 Tax=Xylanimonas cellulosilytica (strain DSM 15894 / JCM 12276 / CECT 5975 / KCTC 9989 / LMG 20990 / NBRC 107835 / XIL07) TaxID=446471 RepID=D1BU15_XYLCX|nr:DUF4190 domain-containing protein [Xylanimonas cellulosilytica]ACZ29179.1 hypothetical protein Xcel_0139 [Xylanimonas cellulosilytica DSM 15894]
MSDPYAPPPASPDEVLRAPAPLPSQVLPYTTDGSVPAPSPYSTDGSVPPPSAYGTPLGDFGAAPPPNPYQGTPYESSSYAAYGAPPRPAGRDGVSIAALVTGLLGLGPVPLVLGIVGVRRTGRTRQAGRGLAVAGIVLGALQILVGVAAIIALVVAGARGAFGPIGAILDTGEPGMYYGDNARLDALWDACDAGEMQACDDLFALSEEGSDYEWFGGTCGERADGAAWCTKLSVVD